MGVDQCLVWDVEPALGQEFFDVLVAEGEAHISQTACRMISGGNWCLLEMENGLNFLAAVLRDNARSTCQTVSKAVVERIRRGL
jgi:hypothetical protein